MAEESINKLSLRIDQLREALEEVEANYTLERKKTDSHFPTDLANIIDKLLMIKSTVDALISKIPKCNETLTREQKGRENRDSGLPSVDSAVFKTNSCILEDNGLSDLTLVETNEPSSGLDQQCPSCLRPVVNLLQETAFSEQMPSERVSCENEDIQTASSDGEDITTITPL
ncbi:uncharacterized protein LOC117339079 isoform X1 [Pecten maximus]|uniref:uncharacterized protein LOC117339079 isoform X1 n=1 Tax=Pecten maximus TaxID=6579 RepID=UPI001458620C|nr:uncharacterized protein LOC117339079 isoform X1 [Pecten maximus]